MTSQLNPGFGLVDAGRVSTVVTGEPLEPWSSPARPLDWRTATDAELAAGFADGDELCLEESYRRWVHLIYAVALRSLGSAGDAEEVTQQVFIGAWRSRANYDPSSGSLPGWLLGICRHRIADHQRARGRDLRLVQTMSSDLDVRLDTEPVATVVDRVVLTDEISRLPDPRGTILRLAFWEGRSYPQIAEQLDLPLGTVKSHARRALLHLRGRLEEMASWST
jgi:RNA polymerase sigma-70 factor, ECF subfamily